MDRWRTCRFLDTLPCETRCCVQNMKRHAQELRLERDHLKKHNCRELVKIGELRQELADLNIEIDINNFMPRLDDDSDSDSTATGT